LLTAPLGYPLPIKEVAPLSRWCLGSEQSSGVAFRSKLGYVDSQISKNLTLFSPYSALLTTLTITNTDHSDRVPGDSYFSRKLSSERIAAEQNVHLNRL